MAWLWFGLPTVVFLSLFLIFPVLRLIVIGLGMPLALWWSDAQLWHWITFTYSQALLSTILSAGLGTLAAFLYSEHSFRGRRLLWDLSLVCYSLPPLLVVLSFIGFWGRSGLWNGVVPQWFAVPNGIYGWPGILMVHTFFNFPLFLRLVGAALMEMDRRPEKVALSLGATRWQTLWWITWPKIRPAFGSAFMLSFLACSASFLVVLLLGGGPKFTTIEVAIYQATKIEINLAKASRLALIQMMVSLSLYLFLLKKGSQIRMTRRLEVAMPALFQIRNVSLRRTVLIFFGILLFFVTVGPLGSLVKSGIHGISFGSELLSAVAMSVGLALGVGLLSVLAAFGLAYSTKHAPSRAWSRALSLLGAFPLSVSSMVLTLSFFIAYPALQVSWLNGPWPVIVVQSILALPLVFRVLVEGFSRLPVELYRSAQSLGASPRQILWWVEIPALKPSLMTAFLLGGAFSLGEVAVVLMFQSVPTLPLRIFQLMNQYRFEEAGQFGLVLLVMVVGLFGLLGRVRA